MGFQSFALEQLEGRALFSVGAPMEMEPVFAAAMPVVRAGTNSPLAGPFNAHGTFTKPFHNPDVGPTYNFTGGGRKSSLGKFKLTGHVQTPGFVNNGRSGGHLTLTNSHGTITLVLHGPPQPPGILPDSFTYAIRKGTGAYVNSRGKGQMLVSASDTTSKFVFRFNQAT